jgi:hypothetical protein
MTWFEVSKNQNANGDTINMLFMNYLVKKTSLEMKHCCLIAFMSFAHLWQKSLAIKNLQDKGSNIFLSTANFSIFKIHINLNKIERWLINKTWAK